MFESIWSRPNHYDHVRIPRVMSWSCPSYYTKIKTKLQSQGHGWVTKIVSKLLPSYPSDCDHVRHVIFMSLSYLSHYGHAKDLLWLYPSYYTFKHLCHYGYIRVIRHVWVTTIIVESLQSCPGHYGHLSHYNHQTFESKLRHKSSKIVPELNLTDPGLL